MLNMFRVEVSNKYQVLQELMYEETLDSAWNRVKEAFVSTCREVLGPKKHHHKEWISVKTLNKIQERKKKKAAMSPELELRNPRHRKNTVKPTEG